jgi:outer membrane receptor protein involved in Fe transport
MHCAFCSGRVASLHVVLMLLCLHLFSFKALGDSPVHALRGRVVQTESPDPIAGAVVRLAETGTRKVTDADGRFTFEELHSGRYTLVVMHSQYLEQRIEIEIPASSELEIEMQPPLHYHETITVTAAPWAVDRADIAQSANTLDTVEVRARSGPSIGDAVSSLPGVRNISTGEAGGVPMIRGQTNERIRVLTNGFPHDYYQFSRRHMPNVETYDCDSIEVIRGPASVLYGTQAMGGLTNLVSAPLPTASSGSSVFMGEGLLAYAGNNEAKIGHARVEGARGKFGGRAAWTRRAAEDTSTPEGDLPNTDYDQQASLLEMGYQSPGGFRLDGQYRYWANELGFYIPPQPDFRLHLRNDVGQFKAVLPSGWGEWNISTSISRNTRRVFPNGRAQGAKVDLELLTQTFRASLKHKSFGPIRGWIQVEHNRQKNKSFGPVTLLPFYRNQTWAFAVFEEFRLIHSGTLDRFVLHLALRYDHRNLKVPANPERDIPDDFGRTYEPVTGSIGLVYRFNRSLSAGLSFSRGWRNPSEYELFAEGPHDGALLYERGNPALKEETNLNVEFTLRLEEERVRGFMALFRDSYDNYIYQKLTGEIQDNLPVGVFDQANAVVKGFEGQLSVDTTPWLTLNVAGDALRSKNRATGRRLPFSPPDRAIVGAHFHGAHFHGAHFHGLLSDEWIHPFVEIRSIFTGKGKISGPDEPFPLDTDSYMLIDLGAGVQRHFEKSVLSFDLWISNLANKSYKDFLDTYKLYASSPGRNIRATLRFLF